jgi:uncharacterized protein YdbL (DUF1318 family)
MFLTRSLRSLIVVLSVASCVTINIYFPAAAAEKAADEIIKDVLGEQPTGAAPGSVAPPPGSSLLGTITVALVNFVVSPAHAQTADLNIAGPAIDGIRASMRARHDALKPYYDSGAVGFTNDALLAQPDVAAVPLSERNKVKQLIADENKDRLALYREIAKANNHPEWEADIRATFAREWVDNARAGWRYQDAGGAWKKK